MMKTMISDRHQDFYHGYQLGKLLLTSRRPRAPRLSTPGKRRRYSTLVDMSDELRDLLMYHNTSSDTYVV